MEIMWHISISTEHSSFFEKIFGAFPKDTNNKVGIIYPCGDMLKQTTFRIGKKKDDDDGSWDKTVFDIEMKR